MCNELMCKFSLVNITTFILIVWYLNSSVLDAVSDSQLKE